MKHLLFLYFYNSLQSFLVSLIFRFVWAVAQHFILSPLINVFISSFNEFCQWLRYFSWEISWGLWFMGLLPFEWSAGSLCPDSSWISTAKFCISTAGFSHSRWSRDGQGLSQALVLFWRKAIYRCFLTKASHSLSISLSQFCISNIFIIHTCIMYLSREQYHHNTFFNLTS